MWATTKPKSTAPLPAMTTFFPMEDRKKRGNAAVAMWRDSNRGPEEPPNVDRDGGAVPSSPFVTARKHIVIVDDDAYVLRVVESALRAEGFDVVGFADPRAALEGLRDTVPDLILCDVLMPFMD